MNGNESCRLLILDCDGVLIRSEDANLAYYNHIFAQFGLAEVTLSNAGALASLHTLSTPQVIETFFPPGLREEARSFVAGLSFEPFVSLVQPEPGWDGVLARWRAEGGKAAVATNRGSSARAVLEAAGLYRFMDEVVTIQHVSRPKPHPDLLVRALASFGVRPEESLYVGDSVLDQQAADAAGVPFLGFRYPAAAWVSRAEEVADHLHRLAARGHPGTLRTAVP